MNLFNCLQEQPVLALYRRYFRSDATKTRVIAIVVTVFSIASFTATQSPAWSRQGLMQVEYFNNCDGSTIPIGHYLFRSVSNVVSSWKIVSSYPYHAPPRKFCCFSFQGNKQNPCLAMAVVVLSCQETICSCGTLELDLPLVWCIFGSSWMTGTDFNLLPTIDIYNRASASVLMDKSIQCSYQYWNETLR